MPVRMKDIAKDVGVSTVTVSKVLRGSTEISERTRKLVLKRMRELNYQPNMLAQGLASGRSYAVGLVVPDLVHPFFGELAKALGGVLRASHRALIVASSEEDAEVERQEVRTLIARGVDVLVVASCETKAPPKKDSFASGGVPYLLVDRYFKGLKASFVGSDDVRVGRMATEHLIGLGRRRIAHIGAHGMSPSVDRLRGYQEALAGAGLEVPESLVVKRERFEETGDSAGFQAMQELLGRKTRPDAVFCYNDLSAIGAMQAAMDAGLRVPEDIAFVGCGNLRYAEYLKVPLTSVDQATKEMGEMAAQMALEIAGEPKGAVRRVLIEPRLVVRGFSVVG